MEEFFNKRSKYVQSLCSGVDCCCSSRIYTIFKEKSLQNACLGIVMAALIICAMTGVS